MTSGDYALDQVARMQGAPAAAGHIRDLETIVTLVELGALLREDDQPGAPFTFDQLMAEVLGLLDEGQTVDRRDIEIVLPGVRCCQKVKGGYKWR